VVSEQLEESLRHEIESYVEKRLSGIKQDISQLQNQVNETCKLLLESGGEGQWDGSLAASITEHLHAAHERGVELAAAESSRSQASSNMAIVKAAIEEIQGQRSQSEVLKALVNRASSFAPRVAFFVVKDDQARGWRARGFQGTVGDEAVQQISFSLLADTVVGEVARSQKTWSGIPTSHSENQQLLSRLGEQEPQRIVAVPLVVRSRTVAVLYGDSAGLDSEALNLEALETLVRFAGMAVELLLMAHAAAPKAQAAPQPAETHAYTPTREYAEPPRPETHQAEPERAVTPPAPPAPAPPAEPKTPQFGNETIPHLAYAPLPTGAESLSEQPAAAPASDIGQPAAPASGEAPGAAPVVAEAAVAGRRRYGSYDAELPITVTDEEERRAHNDARRFARLLVSEIKLYNEDKVVEGRSHGDLYGRLREYIDRSRDMYDKRVKPVVSAKYDYFHHELVNALAEGDAAKMGEKYPGTTVTA
jgi:hypothetical protein